jgi:hypothetical protein
MKMRNSPFLSRRAMSVTEMIVAMGVFSIAMTAMLTASVALQMSFGATENYFTNQGDQLRVMDYFNTDLRRAIAMSLNSGTVIYKGTSYSNNIPTGATKYLTVLIPNYRDQTTSPSTVRFPTLSSDGSLVYGTNPVVVSYYLLGSSIYRVEVDPDLSAGDSRNSPTSIADNVSDFNVTDSKVSLPLITQTVVSISATFAPKFSRRNWAASLLSNTTNARAGTTVGTQIQMRNVF